MILVFMILILMAGGIIAWIVSRWSTYFCRVISLLTVLADFALILFIAFQSGSYNEKGWMIEFRSLWIP
jgi:NADH-quinone oxidoreductase subunit M